MAADENASATRSPAVPKSPTVLRAPGQPHFLNTALFAANVMEIDIPLDVVAPLQALVPQVRQLEEPKTCAAVGPDINLYIDKPPTWRSDIRWISPHDEASFAFFEKIFHQLDIARHVAPYVEHDRELKLYASFFVTRSQCTATDMHVDWSTEQNDGFTLMAPLTPNCADLGMSYMTMRGEEHSYTYEVGKALLFGDHFYHSTAVGQTDERAVFLAMNFGTDRMGNWANMVRTTGNQGDFHRQPDGKFVRRSTLPAHERASQQADAYG